MVGIGRRVSPGLDIQDYGMAVRSMKARWDVGCGMRGGTGGRFARRGNNEDIFVVMSIEELVY